VSTLSARSTDFSRLKIIMTSFCYSNVHYCYCVVRQSGAPSIVKTRYQLLAIYNYARIRALVHRVHCFELTLYFAALWLKKTNKWTMIIMMLIHLINWSSLTNRKQYVHDHWSVGWNGQVKYTWSKPITAHRLPKHCWSVSLQCLYSEVSDNTWIFMSIQQSVYVAY